MSSETPGFEKPIRMPWRPLTASYDLVRRAAEAVWNAIQWLDPNVRAAIVGAVLASAAGLFIAILTSPDSVARWFVNTKLRVKHVSFYGKILQYKDKSVDDKPIFTTKFGQIGSGLVRDVPIFDEAVYTSLCEFHPHKAPLYESVSHTSGECESNTILPLGFSPGEEIEAYDKANKKALSQQVELLDEDGRYRDLVMSFSRYVNGFQRKADHVGYESDVGLHIRYETDLATVVVDFNSLDYENLIAGEPNVFLITSDGRRQQIESSYENGIVKCNV